MQVVEVVVLDLEQQPQEEVAEVVQDQSETQMPQVELRILEAVEEEQEMIMDQVGTSVVQVLPVVVEVVLL
jgi:hypothetical protein